MWQKYGLSDDNFIWSNIVSGEDQRVILAYTRFITFGRRSGRTFPLIGSCRSRTESIHRKKVITNIYVMQLFPEASEWCFSTIWIYLDTELFAHLWTKPGPEDIKFPTFSFKPPFSGVGFFAIMYSNWHVYQNMFENLNKQSWHQFFQQWPLCKAAVAARETAQGDFHFSSILQN